MVSLAASSAPPAAPESGAERGEHGARQSVRTGNVLYEFARIARIGAQIEKTRKAAVHVEIRARNDAHEVAPRLGIVVIPKRHSDR